MPARPERPKRRAALLVLVAAAAALAIGATQAGGTSSTAAAANGPILGIVGDAARFETQTGQESLIRHAFLGWGHGHTYGGTFAGILDTFGPLPMIHLGTGSPSGKEVITPGGIAAGDGDAYLVALNRAIAIWGKALYIRPMGEMNNGVNFFSAYTESGQARDANHSTASYRKAFARISLILHGGTLAQVNARLKQAGLTPVRGAPELLENAFPRLRILWTPLARNENVVPGNAPENYYPGAKYVDVEGADLYDERAGDTAAWPALEKLYQAARGRGKPFAIAEWGLVGVDDAAFVRHMCTFLRTKKVEAAVFYESKPGSTWDLASKPQSRAAYRQCLVPLGGPLPDWAAANAPGGGVSVKALTLTPRPASGAAPLAVRFAIRATLSVPVAHWQVLFGDGSMVEGNGGPPATVQHTFARPGVHQATLFVFAGPPFTPDDAPFFVSADVKVGSSATRIVSFVPNRTQGPAPLKVSFQTDLAPSVRPTGWTIVWGDGKRLDGTGAPPRFAGHQWAADGDYDVLLLLDAAGGDQYASTAAITVGAGGGGGSGGGSGGGGGQQQPPAPPPTARATGTVLVNGQPFTGGTIPYNSTVNVTEGRLRIQSDVGTMTVFGQGGITAVFVLVRGTDLGRPVVEFRLKGGNFSVCPRRRKSSAFQATPRTVVRQLWGNGKGKFRTRGRYASATVRGTIYLTADRCEGTFMRVRQGRVAVNDFPRRRVVILRAPRTLLIRPR